MKIKYFAVETKCGHVGKNYYIPITFAVIADSKKEAAKMGRNFPRVKHHRKDAIISVKELNYFEYLSLEKENDNNSYLKCKNKQEQNKMCIGIEKMIFEDEYNKKKTYSKMNREERVCYKLKKVKSILNSYRLNYDDYASLNA